MRRGLSLTLSIFIPLVLIACGGESSYVPVSPDPTYTAPATSTPAPTPTQSIPSSLDIYWKAVNTSPGKITFLASGDTYSVKGPINISENLLRWSDLTGRAYMSYMSPETGELVSIAEWDSALVE